jgi:hypothetical protein
MPNNHVKELQSTRVTSSGAISSSGCRVHGIWVMGGATNGTVILKNGGASGTTVLTLDVPGITTSGTTHASFLPIPGDGLWFTTDCYAALTTVAGCTVLFSPEKAL